MEALLANMYTYIYDNMYALTGIYDKLTTYSNAIMGTLADGGSLHNAYLIVRTVAFGLLAVYFVIAFGTRMEGREISPSIVFRTLLEFFIGFAFALSSFQIVKWMFELGDGLAALLMSDAAGTDSGLAAFSVTFAKSIDEVSFGNKILFIFKGIFPYLFCMITNMIIMYAVVTRVLRVCVNATLSPIAVANFFDGARRSDGVRFLKKTASMCLQCSAIMVIVAATASLSSYMASSSTFGDALSMQNGISQLKQEMVDTASNNTSLLNSDIYAAVDKLGWQAYESDKMTLKSRYAKARDNLIDKSGKVTSSQEGTYKKYENRLGIRIFSRNENGHYIYNSDGYAVLDSKYVTFDGGKMTDFMNALLGSNNIVILIGLLSIKVGMIKKANSLCNTIVGL